MITLGVGAHVRGSTFDIAQSLINVTSPSTLLITTTGGFGANASGAVLAPVANGIESTIKGGITTTAAGGIASGVDGGFLLSGTANDWPTFSATRSRVLVHPLDVVAINENPGGQGVQAQCTYAPATGAPNVRVGGFTTNFVNSGSTTTTLYQIPLTRIHNGATLVFAQLSLKGAGGHGALPAVMPAFGIFRSQAFGSGYATVALYSVGTGIVVDSSGSLGAYTVQHTITLIPNQNNVIDVTQYTYSILIWDESSTNAVTGNSFDGVQLQFNATNMAFP